MPFHREMRPVVAVETELDAAGRTTRCDLFAFEADFRQRNPELRRHRTVGEPNGSIGDPGVGDAETPRSRGCPRCLSATRDRLRELECAGCLAAQVQRRSLDGNPFERDGMREPIELRKCHVDGPRTRERRTVPSCQRELVHPRGAGERNGSRNALLGHESEPETRRQRAAGQLDSTRQGQVLGVMGERERIEVPLERRLLRIGERRIRIAAQGEPGLVDRAFEARRDADPGIVGKAREERDADPDARDDDLALVRLVVERNRAVVDFDVVDREQGRGSLRLGRLFDQIVDAVRAVGVARQVDLRAHEVHGIQHGRAVPQRGERDVEVERREANERPSRIAIGQRKIT